MNLLWTDQIVNTFVENTNSYNKNVTNSWSKERNVAANELRKYWAIILYMGIVRGPERESYWDHGYFGDEFIEQVGMKRFRFLAISKILHWLDALEISK